MVTRNTMGGFGHITVIPDSMVSAGGGFSGGCDSGFHTSPFEREPLLTVPMKTMGHVEGNLGFGVYELPLLHYMLFRAER